MEKAEEMRENIINISVFSVKNKSIIYIIIENTGWLKLIDSVAKDAR